MDVPCPRCHQSVSLLTTADVAESLGLAAITVRKRARDRGIGIVVDDRTRLYTATDVAELRMPLKRARPTRTPRV